jgi:hypothetical protein
VEKIEKKITWMTRKVQIIAHLPTKKKTPSMGTTLYFVMRQNAFLIIPSNQSKTNQALPQLPKIHTNSKGW